MLVTEVRIQSGHFGAFRLFHLPSAPPHRHYCSSTHTHTHNNHVNRRLLRRWIFRLRRWYQQQHGQWRIQLRRRLLTIATNGCSSTTAAAAAAIPAAATTNKPQQHGSHPNELLESNHSLNGNVSRQRLCQRQGRYRRRTIPSNVRNGRIHGETIPRNGMGACCAWIREEYGGVETVFCSG